MPRVSAPSGLGMSTSVNSVRVPGCSASAIRVTVPGNSRSGSSGTRTTAATPGATPKAASCGTKAETRMTSSCMISNMKVPLVALPCTRLPTSTLHLGDDAVERCDYRGIVPLLMELLDQVLLSGDVMFRGGNCGLLSLEVLDVD